MDRRHFLRFSGAVCAAGALPQIARAGNPVSAGWRAFELTTDISVQDPGAHTRLWIPVPYAVDTAYQRGAQSAWQVGGGGTARLAQAPGYGVQMLVVEWPDAQAPRTVTITSRFQTRNRRVDLTQPPPADAPRESPAALREYLKPTALLPTDGIVKTTADRITRGRQGDLARARAIYEWVVENTCRTASTRGCGVGDVRYMLTANDLNGKCADINSLFVALARAAGIPARDAYGLRVADSELGYKSLGKSGDVTKAQHCRAEFYAAGYGWIPVDPADVRKVMLEEPPGELPLTDAKVRAARVMLFGAWEMNWVAYNHGHDVALPGAAHGPVPFLMYPNGETADGRLDSLDPDGFRYRLSARPVSI
ncbi:twin-arginine translocation signal domain-containing protein [Achromobacter denitrificans]|uniref:Transglutaminase domain-containing protein n=1 Tax=Achromobacter denitrificans TaxID=32002 RepID=A0A427WSV4_ACHDE|nr:MULTISPECIES: transglutaminase domain-containing protein [Achromobacter]MBV2157264.1 transglutaminase domain-containing protein [Achromobacter denitrificans]MDX3881014.1 transglutaminase domain-containing protein [Achromobacter sp.]MPT41667.1 twin-arginine translocation signal domain-containing protein [Achromobacter sp.]QCS62796.1 transglutaminase domain-containing protein [Achromobacter denitrificans]QKQ50048.1 transglutaminase domain-containing protein [Achromobacter denitrificans]